MTLGGNKVSVEFMQSMELSNQKLTLLLKSQEQTNALLQRLIDVDKSFIGVIENFFALRKKLDIDEARRREKRELDLKGTPDDDRF